jgi:hypothetical protein
VLLTRSRLCPRPKPGSSLHLHVLGTPPAFVLSQDQTLREELLKTGRHRATRFTKSVEVRAPPSMMGRDPGLSLVGQGPCVHTRGSDVHQRIPGRKTGFSIWHRRRSPGPQGAGRCDGVEPGHTPRPRVGRRVRMLLSFQRPSHLFGEGSSFPGHVIPSPISERTGKYSAQAAARGRPAYRMAMPGYRLWLRHARRPCPGDGHACVGPGALGA